MIPVSGARAIALLVLTFAPLVCLRICQLRHVIAQSAMTAHATTPADCAPETGSLPDDGALMRDIQRMLMALTEFLPGVMTLVLVLAARWHTPPQQAAPLTPERKIPRPPPRYQPA